MLRLKFTLHRHRQARIQRLLRLRALPIVCQHKLRLYCNARKFCFQVQRPVILKRNNY